MPIEIKSAGILGGGVMGGGIGQALALGGLKVAIRDLNDELIEKTRSTIVDGRYGLKRGVDGREAGGAGDSGEHEVGGGEAGGLDHGLGAGGGGDAGTAEAGFEFAQARLFLDDGEAGTNA